MIIDVLVPGIVWSGLPCWNITLDCVNTVHQCHFIYARWIIIFCLTFFRSLLVCHPRMNSLKLRYLFNHFQTPTIWLRESRWKLSLHWKAFHQKTFFFYLKTSWFFLFHCVYANTFEEKLFKWFWSPCTSLSFLGNGIKIFLLREKMGIPGRSEIMHRKPLYVR